MLRVGFVGLGHMGEPMAAQVAKAGFDLTVFDVRPEPVERVVALGAHSVETIASLAHCDVILIAVVDDRQVSDVLMGNPNSPGILGIAEAGTAVAVHSTVHPETCRPLCTAARERAIDVLDAPVSGGPGGAQTGSLSIMVGGSGTALDRCRPVLLAMADHVTLLGGPGACNSWVVHNWSAIGDSVAHYHAGGALGLANLTYKDLSLALSIAHARELPLPGTALTAQLLEDVYRSAERFVRSSDGSSTEIDADTSASIASEI